MVATCNYTHTDTHPLVTHTDGRTVFLDLTMVLFLNLDSILNPILYSYSNHHVRGKLLSAFGCGGKCAGWSGKQSGASRNRSGRSRNQTDEAPSFQAKGGTPASQHDTQSVAVGPKRVHRGVADGVQHTISQAQHTISQAHTPDDVRAVAQQNTGHVGSVCVTPMI